MTDGIGRIFGGNGNYGSYGYTKQGGDKSEGANGQPVTPDYSETQVDPSKVMDFLAANNFFVAPTNTAATTTSVELDQATQDRVGGYMEKFEMIYAVVLEEFGEELAPIVMDYVMDYLMDMAA